MARILVIDDNAQNLDLAAKLLVSDNHEVDTAENGLIGLEKLKSGQYDLMITNIEVLDPHQGIVAAIKVI